MSIKVTIGESKPQEKPFPKLMIYIKTQKLVVLFAGQQVGTVVWADSDNPDWAVGDYDNDWDIERFTDFNGSITLQND